MKRGFDSHEDAKNMCGTQFFQYLAKTALASGVATNEQKLSILKDITPPHKSCAGCKMPVTTSFRHLQCECGQVIECSWDFCPGRSNAHICPTCEDEGWCSRNHSSWTKTCFKCERGVCSRTCMTKCVFCLSDEICKPCAGPLTDVVDKRTGTTFQTCKTCEIKHEESFQKLVESCRDCQQRPHEIGSCVENGCNMFVCPHGRQNPVESMRCTLHKQDKKKKWNTTN